jgi:hypothetical protein
MSACRYRNDINKTIHEKNGRKEKEENYNVLVSCTLAELK